MRIIDIQLHAVEHILHVAGLNCFTIDDVLVFSTNYNLKVKKRIVVKITHQDHCVKGI